MSTNAFELRALNPELGSTSVLRRAGTMVPLMGDVTFNPLAV